MKLVLKPTSTGFIGELSNLLLSDDCFDGGLDLQGDEESQGSDYCGSFDG